MDLEEKYTSERIENRKWIKWLFPAILILVVVVLGSLKISGSSVGVYYQYFYGTKDSNLVFGYPQGVRGDEWNTVTPTVISQSKQNYPLNNNAIGKNQNMSVLLDVPYKNWLISLRPWNLWFLIMPLSIAFAFKWWTLSAFLAITSYFFILKLYPKKYLFAALASSFLLLSPFIQWWYRDYLLATIAWGFLILLIAMHFIEQDVKRWQKIGLALLFGYSIASFILIEYPPFQIMTVFSLGLFYIGWLYQKNLFTKNNRKSLLKLLIWLIFGSVLALIPLLIYYIQDHPAISAVMGTTYPAKRIYESGSAGIHTLAHLLSGPFMAEIQKHTNAAKFYWGNQSEAAMFIQFSPILILPAIYAIYKSYKNNKRLRLDIVLLIVGLLIIYAYLFIPHLTLLYKILLFSSIPPNRMVLGIGLLDFLLLITLAIYYVKNPMRLKYANTIALITIACFLWSGLYTIQHYPDLIQTPIIVLGAAVWMGIALWLLLTKHPTASIIMLLIMTIISVYRVNPLYKGLSPLTGTPLSASIQNIVQKNPSKEWLTTEFILQDYPQANGAKSLTGDYSYPQTNIWKLFDSKNSDSYIYNRSAHVLAVVDNNNGISLLNENTFIIHINPCSNLVNALNIGYILTTYPENNRCLEQVSKIDFPKVTTYIYAFKPI